MKTITAAQYRKLKRPGRNWMPRAKPADRTMDGITFDSRAEMLFYAKSIRERALTGELLFWCAQPVFWLGGVSYRPDFFLMDRARGVSVVDVKGKYVPPEVLRRWKRNAAQMKAIHGIDVGLAQEW